METKVFLLDKPIDETWSAEEVRYLVNEFMVEVQQLPAMPHRAVAMNAPIDGRRPIHMTWKANCTLQEVPYSVRWNENVSVDYNISARQFDGMCGVFIKDILGRMLACAKGRLGPVSAHMNGVDVTVNDGDTVEERWEWMLSQMSISK